MTAPRPATGTFSGPIRLVLCASLLFGGGALVVRGWRAAGERAAVTEVGERFLIAVRDGDALAAHAFLADEHREAHARRVATFDWPPTPDAEVSVRRVHLEGDEAIVETRIERNLFQVRPVLQLRRSNGSWRITAITGLTVDPDWVKTYERTLDERDRTLTEELRSAGWTTDRN